MKLLTKVFLGAFVGAVGYGLWADLDRGPHYPEGATEEQKAKILQLHKIKREGGRFFVDAREEWMGQRLYLVYQPQTIADGPGWLRSYFMYARNLLGGIEASAPGNGYKQVVIDVRIPTTNDSGESGHARGMLVHYDWQRLKQADWEKMPSSGAAERIEKVSFQRLGQLSANEYCADAELAENTPRFCTQVFQ